MKAKLAAFEKELKNQKRLEKVARLTSLLFTAAIEKLELPVGQQLGYEEIFQILHLNFDNPRAMNCFIFYDIEDNRLRVKLAKYLLEKGCQRVQKSVYLANISKKIYDEIFETFQELEEVFNPMDSIFMVPIGEYHLAEMRMVGKDVDMQFSRSQQHVIFI